MAAEHMVFGRLQLVEHRENPVEIAGSSLIDQVAQVHDEGRSFIVNRADAFFQLRQRAPVLPGARRFLVGVLASARTANENNGTAIGYVDCPLSEQATADSPARRDRALALKLMRRRCPGALPTGFRTPLRSTTGRSETPE
jgi:hypothetical protein